MRGAPCGSKLLGMTSLLDPPAIRDFAGEVVAPGGPAFEASRRVVNAAVDRRPALIARCATPYDVAAALRHACERELRVTVRGGGHAPGGFAVADGALVIDVSAMRAVYVDPARRRARVQGGATWRELDAAAQSHGLAVTGARLPSVGVAGCALGSGSGWLERKLGLASDHLVAARVVTADGDVVRASADEHPDLLWALRGAGVGFGIVVELELALHPVGPEVTGGLLTWPAERAAEVGAAYAALMADAPDDLGGGLMLTGPGAVTVVALWTGARDRAAERLAPLRALAPVADTVRPLPYAAFQGLLDVPVARTGIDGGFLTGLPEPAIEIAAAHMRTAPAPACAAIFQPLGGAFARVPEAASPLGRRDAAWHWHAPAAWFEPAHDAAGRAWSLGLRHALAPWSAGGTYPNFLPEGGEERLRAAFSPTTWVRLRRLRAVWDPEDVFAAPNAVPVGTRRALAH